MLNYLKTFFYPEEVVYSYNQPKEFITDKIHQILERKIKFFSGHDMKGHFLSSNTFIINIKSFAFTQGFKYGSTLSGEIIESENGATKVITKAKPSYSVYGLFIFCFVLGLIYLYKFAQSISLEPLIWSLTFLIIGPVLSIAISVISIASIRERYILHIQKELEV